VMADHAASPLLPRVLVVGPLPPPVQGAALVTQLLLKFLQLRATIELAVVSPDGLQRNLRYYVQRLLRVGRACQKLVAFRFKGGRSFYLACAGGHGTVYDLMLVTIARIVGLRIHLHHHAFSYITRRPLLTRLLLRVAGTGALHICLCRHMAERLGAQYGSVRKTVVLSNAALITPGVLHGSGDTLYLGYMSNLIASKGLDRAIEVMRHVCASRRKVKLIVAGPIVDATGAKLIAGAQREFADAFEYRGPVYGSDKEVFFDSIDVFLFPTRYVNEAQPLVVLEALAQGIPVIANDLGCIGDDISTLGGIVVAADSEFVAVAVQAIAQWAEDRAALAEASKRALDRSKHLHAAARDDLITVVGQLACP
jgi:glycosyltransferase involved in cell wall biosynthesis